MSSAVSESSAARETSTAPQYDDMQLVTFKLGQNEYGIDVRTVVEVVRPGRISRCRPCPGFAEGVAKMRGLAVAIVDLRKRLEIQPVNDRFKLRFMIMTVDKVTVGVIVDSVSEVVPLAGGNIRDVPSSSHSETACRFVKAVGRIGDKLIRILDLEKVFSTEEIRTLEGMQAAETKV